MKTFQFVEIYYRSKYIAVILDRLNKSNNVGYLYLILIVRDRLGNIPKRRILHIFSQGWTKPVKAIDISNINSDWFRTDNLPYHLFNNIKYNNGLLNGYSRNCK